MKERPILFSGPMVRAILDGRKVQTRRVVKPQPSADFMPEVGIGNRTMVDGDGEAFPGPAEFAAYDENEFYRCPYGQPGDRLWVKETWHTDYPWNGTKPTMVPETAAIHYAATSENFTGRVLRPCLFMRRWMSRITLEITAVRVERLQEITKADAEAEGLADSYSIGTYQITGDRFTAEVVEDFFGGIPKVGEHWQGQNIQHVMYRPPVLLNTARDNYRELWGHINGPDSWEANPWVWVVEFRRVRP